jgi:type I restriction-modification system DNA methylase subunit
MVSYSDSEVKIFHPLCEASLNWALKNLSLEKEYEVLHHQYTGTLEMDYVVRNIHTKKYLCVVEVKRTPADVQSTRYQIQAQSYVQMNEPENEKPFYILTNLEKLISFRYESGKPRVYQQMLLPGLEDVCDFSKDDEKEIIKKLAAIFTRLLDAFRNGKYKYFTTLEQFLAYMNSIVADDKRWKSSMAMLMYEYIRGAFRAVRRTEFKHDVHKFHNDVRQVCIEGNSVDFDGIFAYNTARYLPRLTMPASIFADIYKYGNINISGDSIADALHDMISENKRHDGEVATDLELAGLASVLARMSNGPLAAGKRICDPAAGSGSLICSSINVFNAKPNQLQANDCNPKLIEILSLRLGLSFPKVIAKPDVPQVTSEDIVNMSKADFNDVDVVLLNPPFVAGINCVNRKVPFYDKIRTLKGSEAMTKVGQMNLGAVFLETVCYLANPGTTIACIFPKAHLTERGEEAIAFRKMLLHLFGLHTIFNYPGEGLFDSVTEETCIFVGKVLQRANDILVYSSDVKVADIDLQDLQCVVGGYSRTDFMPVFPGVEARLFDWTELNDAVEDGWRMVCSEMGEAIQFIENNINRCTRLTNITNTTKVYRKGRAGVDGGSDLIFFDSIPALYQKYEKHVTLEEGMRNAKSNDFKLKSGDSKFLNFNGVGTRLAAEIAKDYISLARDAKKQQRKVKSASEWETIAKKDGQVKFSNNSVLIPTKTRKSGRVHLSDMPLYVSTNFVVFTYPSMCEAEIIASYMTTVFYQLECEVTCKSHAGVRKGEVGDVVTTHVPVFRGISPTDISKIQAEIPNIEFLNLNDPQISKTDAIWAEILFGPNAKACLDNAQRLLRFLANRRNRRNS